MLPAWTNNGSGADGFGYGNPVSWMNSYNALGASNPQAAQAQANPLQLSNGITPNVAGAGSVAAPGMGGGFGMNLPTANLALGGIQTIGNLWNAFENRKLAREEFDYKKGVTDVNLKNQIQSYNTTLEDRSRSRAYTEGQDATTAQSYVDKNRLSR